jgi:cytidine deaminase
MKELEIRTKVTVCSQDELPTPLRELVQMAKDKTKDAYCPYSHYHVGAAALLEDGQVITGANQENAAYPSGLCAERTTLFAANANNPHTAVEALAVACYTNGHFTTDVASPCGACRQVMIETEQRFATPMKVILYCETGCYVFEDAKDLLPLSFAADNLLG